MEDNKEDKIENTFEKTDNEAGKDKLLGEDEIIIEKNDNQNEKPKNGFACKLIISILSFVLGAVFMYLLAISIGNIKNNEKNITKETIKTTTLEEESDLKAGINNVYDATVYIEVSTNSTPVSGSGFVYKKDDKKAYILTNYHVINGGSKYIVTFTDGKALEAQLVTGDEYYDVAVLSVNANEVKAVATLGDSSKVELGDTVFTVGSPFGKEYMGTITKGIISGVDRMISVSSNSGTSRMEVIQTDASINSGNSGGALCNIKGQVIGITSSKLAGSGIEGMGFAIPINSILSTIDAADTGSKIERPYVGAQLVDITNTFALQFYYGIRISDDVEFGTVVSEVEKGKPLDKAGLKMGDVIVEVDGTKVEDTSYFKYLLYKHSVGDSMKVKYYRENKLLEATIELTESVKSE